MVWVAKEHAERRVRTDLPHEVQRMENVRIPMADGTELFATIWLPVTAEETPVPAILEYLPYRRQDFTALRDELRHPYFAGHGYASVRVDLRGSGDSDGIMLDEYLLQEQEDGLDVLTWLSEQPWCTGSVGIIGKSWGGFNGLQIAAHNHPALKAVVTLYFTDDRYADDVHYRGGAVLASEMEYWASTMLAYNVRPPVPSARADWKEVWLDRLENTPPYIHAWLREQLRTDYWKHGSIIEDYSQVQVPVLAVGGWFDGYKNPVFRVLEGLSGPRKAIVGPWVHEYPEVATPQPAIGFLQEALRWWDTYLKGEDRGVTDDPDLRVWLQQWQTPTVSVPDAAIGEFVQVPEWPQPSATVTTLHADARGGLSAAAPSADLGVLVQTPLAHGAHGGVWCPFGQLGDLPSDQRFEDALAVSFDSEPVTEPTKVLGMPTVALDVTADKPAAHAIVRLLDVHPDGTSRLVSIGIDSLHHDETHEHVHNVAGKRLTRTITLDACGYVLEPGHKWRIAIATHYWPRVWPTPENPTLDVHALSVHLPTPAEPLEPHEFPSPETAAPLETTVDGNSDRTRDVQHNYLTGEWEVREYADTGFVDIVGRDRAFREVETDVYTITEGKPLSARVSCERTIYMRMDGEDTRVETVSVMWADAEHYFTTDSVRLFHGDELVGEREWEKQIPRVEATIDSPK